MKFADIKILDLPLDRKGSLVDDPTAICICNGIPNNKIPSSTTQGDDHGGYHRGSLAPTHLFLVVGHAQARVGAWWWGRGVRHFVVAHSIGRACVHFQWEVWRGLEWVLLEGF